MPPALDALRPAAWHAVMAGATLDVAATQYLAERQAALAEQRLDCSAGGRPNSPAAAFGLSPSHGTE